MNVLRIKNGCLRLLRSVAAVALAVGLALVSLSCTPTSSAKTEAEPPARVVSADSESEDAFPGSNLSTKDVLAMTQQTAESLLRSRTILERTTRATIVLDSVRDRTSAGVQVGDLTLARLAVALTRHAGERIVFVMRKADFKVLLRERRTGSDAAEDALVENEGALKPEFALTGEFYDHPRGRTNYYFCSFQLVNLRTRAIEWADAYEIKKVGDFVREGAKRIDLWTHLASLRRTQGRLVRGTLLPEGALSSGDQFLVRFRTNVDCCFYVFVYDSSGVPAMLFPHPQITLANRVRGGVEYELPGGDQSYELDDVPGRETLYFIASLAPMNELDLIRERLERADTDADRRALARDLTNAIHATRNSATVVVFPFDHK